jgi:hypothetical protein
MAEESPAAIKPTKLMDRLSSTAQSAPLTASKPKKAVVSTVPSFLSLLKAFDSKPDDVQVRQPAGFMGHPVCMVYILL